MRKSMTLAISIFLTCICTSCDKDFKGPPPSNNIFKIAIQYVKSTYEDKVKKITMVNASKQDGVIVTVEPQEKDTSKTNVMYWFMTCERLADVKLVQSFWRNEKQALAVMPISVSKLESWSKSMGLTKLSDDDLRTFGKLKETTGNEVKDESLKNFVRQYAFPNCVYELQTGHIFAKKVHANLFAFEFDSKNKGLGEHLLGVVLIIDEQGNLLAKREFIMCAD